MLSIQPSKNSQKCTPNLIPARIDHNGPIHSASQYFQPAKDEKGTSHVYLRGRHLHGTSLPLPENYTGAVLHITDKLAPSSTASGNNVGIEDDEDESMEEKIDVEVKIAEQVGEFDEIVVWQHGEEVDREKDMFVRGIREWVGWAESMHGKEEDVGKGNGV